MGFSSGGLAYCAQHLPCIFFLDYTDDQIMNVLGKQEKVEAEEETLTSSSTLQLMTVNHLQMSCVQSTMAHEPAKVLSIKFCLLCQWSEVGNAPDLDFGAFCVLGLAAVGLVFVKVVLPRCWPLYPTR